MPDTQQLLADLAELVNAESPSGETDLLERCADVVVRQAMRIAGYMADRIEVDGQTHLLLRHTGTNATPAVLILGHYDTVWPRGTLERWPFSVEGDVATGPGAFDMKAGIVIALHAMAELQADGVVVDPIQILLTSDEEVGSLTSRKLIEKVASEVDHVLVLEPGGTGGSVKVGRKGASIYHVDVAGKAAHAGLEPEKGANALLALAQVLPQVAALGAPDLGTSVTPTVASAGHATNVVPPVANARIDARALTVAEQERVDAEIKALSGTVDGTTVTITGGVNRPPLEHSATRKLADEVHAAALSLGVEPPAEITVGGASDGNFTGALGTSTLDGLGAIGDGAHAEGEHVLISELAPRVRLVTALIRRLVTG